MRALLVGVVAAGLAACGSGEMTDNERAGTKAGAVGGAAAAAVLMAAGPVGIAVGAASGALKGNRIGNMLDGDEKARAEAAARRAASTGQRIDWQKTDMLFRATASGTARPVGRTTRNASGHLCRRIEQSATKNGKTEKETVTLCKGADGWAPVGTEQAKAPVTRDPAE